MAPLLTDQARSVLEVGCGTGALARRVVASSRVAEVLATDKSSGMLQAARRLAKGVGTQRTRFEAWDALDEAAFPAPNQRFDLIFSCVMIVYLEEDQAEDLIVRLAARLNPGGVLAFVEQDLMTDSVNDTSGIARPSCGRIAGTGTIHRSCWGVSWRRPWRRGRLRPPRPCSRFTAFRI